MKPETVPFLRNEGFGTLGSGFEEPELPPLVSLAPATTGAWLSLALLASLTLVGFAFALRRYQRRAPRRAAAKELRRLLTTPAAEAKLDRAQVILKACAMHSFGRTRVAALSGQRWVEFLAQTGPSAGFSGRVAAACVTLSERGAAHVSSEDATALLLAAEKWAKGHRVRA